MPRGTCPADVPHGRAPADVPADEPQAITTACHPKNPALGFKATRVARRILLEGPDCQEIQEGEKVLSDCHRELKKVEHALPDGVLGTPAPLHVTAQTPPVTDVTVKLNRFGLAWG